MRLEVRKKQSERLCDCFFVQKMIFDFIKDKKQQRVQAIAITFIIKISNMY